MLAHVLPEHEVLIITKLSHELVHVPSQCRSRTQLARQKSFATADLVEEETVQEEKLPLVQIERGRSEAGS